MDVIFILLIFFAVSSSLLTNDKGIPVELPQAETLVQEEQGVVIAITKNGKLFFNNKPTTLRNIKLRMGDELQKNPDIQTVIYADRNVPYHYVIQTIDQIKLSGARNFLLEAKKIIKDDNP